MGTLKDLYEIIKELKSLVNAYQNEEMSGKVIEIQEGFFDIREELENIKEENRNLKETIQQMKDNSETEKDLELQHGGYYIRKSERAENKDIRYCAACWNNHKKLMPITRTIGNAKQCCNCHTVIR
jgi:predicted nuclease with TOPRIM domain